MVELSTHNPKFKGSNPASLGTGREKIEKSLKRRIEPMLPPIGENLLLIVNFLRFKYF